MRKEKDAKGHVGGRATGLGLSLSFIPPLCLRPCVSPANSVPNVKPLSSVWDARHFLAQTKASGQLCTLAG